MTGRKRRRVISLRLTEKELQHLLGVFRRKPWHPSPAVREEIRQLDKRIEQMEFLMRLNIRTLAQLRDLRAKTEVEVRQLNAERNRLYKADPESDQIPQLTQRLQELRKAIKLCKQIEEHSLQMAQRQEEEQKRRAEQERRNAYERNTIVGHENEPGRKLCFRTGTGGTGRPARGNAAGGWHCLCPGESRECCPKTACP